MDLMTETSECDTVEREFKHGDMLTEALKKAHFQWEMEELNESFECFKGVYQLAETLPSSGACAQCVHELNMSEEESLKNKGTIVALAI